LAIALVPLMSLGAASVRAETVVTIGDANQLYFQLTSDNRVYLRNLNAFSSSALGCCYNYYIDTNTQNGRDVWATLLSFMAQNKGIMIGIPDSQQPGPVDYVGVW
jgi:hypothetical protein